MPPVESLHYPLNALTAGSFGLKFQLECSTHRVEVSSDVLRLLRFAFEVEVRELYMRASMSVCSGLNVSIYVFRASMSYICIQGLNICIQGLNVSIYVFRPDLAFRVQIRELGGSSLQARVF